MNSPGWYSTLFFAVAALLHPTAAQASDTVKIAEAKPGADGILVHAVECGYQDRATTIRVLLPGRLEKGRRYPVLYVLPVEAADGSRYGDGLKEVKKLGLHDKHGLIVVQPTFARLPWYADHPTDPKRRQEGYLLQVVLPFVEAKYPVQGSPEGRLLLGFSKSGWGAFSLLLRHPDVFGRAAAWDAPLMLDAPGKYGSGEIFGTRENFAKYQVTKLLEERAGKLGEVKRLAVFGYGNFRGEHRVVHALMDRLKIAHAYRDGPRRRHDWHSGWVAEAVEFLVSKPDPLEKGCGYPRRVRLRGLAPPMNGCSCWKGHARQEATQGFDGPIRRAQKMSAATSSPLARRATPYFPRCGKWKARCGSLSGTTSSGSGIAFSSSIVARLRSRDRCGPPIGETPSAGLPSSFARCGRTTLVSTRIQQQPRSEHANLDSPSLHGGAQRAALPGGLLRRGAGRP